MRKTFITHLVIRDERELSGEEERAVQLCSFVRPGEVNNPQRFVPPDYGRLCVALREELDRLPPFPTPGAAIIAMVSTRSPDEKAWWPDVVMKEVLRYSERRRYTVTRLGCKYMGQTLVETITVTNYLSRKPLTNERHKMPCPYWEGQRVRTDVDHCAALLSRSVAEMHDYLVLIGE